MFFIIGMVVVIGSVISGYVLHHGDLRVLNQPTEFLIIGGAAIGSFIISNPSNVMKRVTSNLGLIMKSGAAVSKQQYMDLLLFMYSFFKFMQQKGMLQAEGHIEEPHNSDIFTKFPSVLQNHHATDFICDYIRLITMGVEDHYKLEDMMDLEMESHHHEMEEASLAVVTLGDAFPALGIVAAVLGVIVTMGSITEPPEILGRLIGGALVGTFLGVLLSYGIVGPIGLYLGKYFNQQHKYIECIKIGLISHVQGNAPTISVEFARKVIPSDVMPSFAEVEQAMGNL